LEFTDVTYDKQLSLAGLYPIAIDMFEILIPGAISTKTGTAITSPTLPDTVPIETLIFGVPLPLGLTVIIPEAVEFPFREPIELLG
jgi:hypothetical protein